MTEEQVADIRSQKGYNELQAAKKKTLFQRFIDQFKDFSIIVLIIAAIVSGIVGVSEKRPLTARRQRSFFISQGSIGSRK